jgi:hypothetical protein
MTEVRPSFEDQEATRPTIAIDYEVETIPRTSSPQWKHSYDTVGQIFNVKFDVNVINPGSNPEVLNLDLDGPLDPEIIEGNSEETISVDSTYEITQDDVVNQECVRLTLTASMDYFANSTDSDDSDDSDVESEFQSSRRSKSSTSDEFDKESRLQTQSVITIPNSFFDKLQGMHKDTMISTNRGPMRVADLVSNSGIKLFGSDDLIDLIDPTDPTYQIDSETKDKNLVDFVVCVKIPSQKWVKIPKSGISDFIPAADLIVRPGHEIVTDKAFQCAKDVQSASAWSDTTNENMMYVICTEKKTFITVQDLKVATLEYSELLASKIMYEIVV